MVSLEALDPNVGYDLVLWYGVITGIKMLNVLIF